VGTLALEDAETGEVVEIDTTDPRVRSRFEQEVTERQQKIRHGIRAEAVDVLELDTAAPYLPALQRFFKNRERRR
jgi:hypothetical protein